MHRGPIKQVFGTSKQFGRKAVLNFALASCAYRYLDRGADEPAPRFAGASYEQSVIARHILRERRERRIGHPWDDNGAQGPGNEYHRYD